MAAARGRLTKVERHIALAGLPHLGKLKRSGRTGTVSASEVLGRMLPVAAWVGAGRAPGGSLGISELRNLLLDGAKRTCRAVRS